MTKRENRKEVFIDLRTDFGFKRCLGNENPMRSFLNAFLSEDYGVIRSVVFENVEMPSDRQDGRGVTFDLRCKTDDGTEILVEMQNYSQRLFKTRSNYYLYRLMDRHVKRGFKWNDEKDIPRLLGIFIMDKPVKGLDKLVTRTAELDMDTKTEFWDRMRKYYITLPYFGRDQDSGGLTIRNIWIDIVKNLGIMEEIDPHVFEVADEGLLELIEKARVSALSPEEYARYEAELKIIGDEGSVEAYGYDRGVDDGIEKGIRKLAKETARRMIEGGEPISKIASYLGLSQKEVEDMMRCDDQRV